MKAQVWILDNEISLCIRFDVFGFWNVRIFYQNYKVNSSLVEDVDWPFITIRRIVRKQVPA